MVHETPFSRSNSGPKSTLYRPSHSHSRPAHANRAPSQHTRFRRVRRLRGSDKIQRNDRRPSGRIVLGQVPDGSVSNYHPFWFLARNPADRTHLLDRLQSEGVDARSHFVPLHTTPFALSKWGPPRALPVTEDVCDSVIRLPLHAELTDSDVDLVTSATNKALKA